MRKITVFSTKGVQKKAYETDVTTWGEFKKIIKPDYDLGSLAATESINRADLVNEQAVLPEGDFTVFLRPVKTKSGAGLSFSEARKQLTEEDKQWISDTMGKNWTRASTEELNQCLSRKGATKATGASVSEKPKAKVEKKKSNGVEKVVAAVKDSKEKESQSYLSINKEEVEKILAKLTQGTEGLAEIVEDYGSDEEKDSFAAVQEAIAELNTLFLLPVGKEKSAEELEKEAAAEAKAAAEAADKAETEALAAQYKELQKGF